MGKIKQLDIVYDNQSAVVYAGTPVSGKIRLELKEPLKVKGIKIICHGELSVSFNDTNTKKKHAERHVYFNHSNVAFSGADEPLTAGVHEYAFSFAFSAPGVLPSSFQGRYGYVRYWCSAHVNISLLSRDHSIKKPFSVVSLVDLNTSPLAFTPGYAHKEARFGLWQQLLCCIHIGCLSISVKLPRCAYVPGEQIFVHTEIANNSSRRVKRVEAYLQQNVLYSTAKGGKRFVKGDNKIALLTQNQVKCGDTQIWTDAITVPPLPPTHLGGCQQIAVDYLFNLLITVENQDAILLTIPVQIGTIPLHHQPLDWLPEQISQQIEANSIERQISAAPSAPPLDDDYLIPPPTYEACVYEETEQSSKQSFDDQAAADQLLLEDLLEDQIPTTSYRPLYPTYATLARPLTSN